MIRADGIHLQTVFERLCDALGILITLDHIFKTQPTIKEHWEQYKRWLCVCGGGGGGGGPCVMKMCEMKMRISRGGSHCVEYLGRFVSCFSTSEST